MPYRNQLISAVMALLLLSSLGGCAGPAAIPDTGSASAPQPSARIHVPTGAIVLQSDDSPAYAEVAREIVRQWRGGLEIVHLDDEGALSADARRQVQTSPKKLVVAIGLAASREAAKLAGKKVVFCQVFNYEEHDLVRPWMKGVSALPPVAQQFRAWKELDPRLTRVAVIVGPGLRGLLAEAHAAARENGISLHYVQVDSDLGLRYAYEHLSKGVQGLWLVPDNRVLSADVLRDVFAYSRAHGRQVLATSEQFLSWGATLTVESDYGDIARQVLARLREGAGSATLPGPDVASLTRANVKTNAERVQNLGLASAQRGVSQRAP